MAVGSTGISPSRGSLMTAPIACDGFTVEMPLITLGLWLDGSIISPIAGYRHAGSRPALIADCFSLFIGRNKPKTKLISFSVVSCCFLPAHHGAAANVAHAFAMAIGMCLMNGYSVVKDHPCLPKRKTGREFSYLSTCFLT